MRKHLEIVQWIGVGYASIRMIVGATAAIFLLSKGITLADLATIKSIQYLTYVILDIPLGYLADKKSYKSTFMASVFLCGMWLFIAGNSSSLIFLVIGEACNGISLALLQGAYTAYLIQHDKKVAGNRPTRTILALFQKRSHFFMGISAFLGAAFVQPSDNLPWIIGCFLCLICFVLSFIMLPNYDNSKSVNSNKIDDLKLVYCQIKSKDILRVLFLYFPLFLFYQMFIQFFQPFVKNYFSDYQNLGIFWACLYLFVLFIQSLSGWIGQHIKKDKSMAMISFILSMVILFGMYISMKWYYPMVLVMCALVILQTRLCFLLTQSIFHSRIQDQNRATVDSFISSFFRIVLSGVLFLTGLISFDVFNGIYILYAVLVIIHGICVIKWKNWFDAID